MDFLRGLSKTKQRHDCKFVVINKFSKMAQLIPCKMTLTEEEAIKSFFHKIWVHLDCLNPTKIADL